MPSHILIVGVANAESDSEIAFKLRVFDRFELEDTEQVLDCVMQMAYDGYSELNDRDEDDTQDWTSDEWMVDLKNQAMRKDTNLDGKLRWIGELAIEDCELITARLFPVTDVPGMINVYRDFAPIG